MGLDPLLEQEGRAGSSYTGINLEKDTSGYGLKFIYPEIYSEWDGGNYDDRDKYRAEFETAGVKEMEKKLRKCRDFMKENEPRWAERPVEARFQKVNEEELK